MAERCFQLMAPVLSAALLLCGVAAAENAPAVPEPGVTAPDAFSKGLLPARLADQVREIVEAQLKELLPRPEDEEGTVSESRVEKGKAVSASVGGERYPGAAYRSFLVEQTVEDEVISSEAFIRSTAPWKFKGGVVAPAETYFCMVTGRVLAFNAEQVRAQDAKIATSDDLSKAALDQLGHGLKARLAELAAKYQGRADKLAACITLLGSDSARKEKVRNSIIAQVNQQSQRKTAVQNAQVLTGNDPAGKILWQYENGQFTFYDDLERTTQDLAGAHKEQAALQASLGTEQNTVSVSFTERIRAVKAVSPRERNRILIGEQAGDDEMRADYEAALGEPLKAPDPDPKPADAAQPK